jgi:ankyrin repeat protein
MATDEVEKVQSLCHEIERRNWEDVESLLNSFPEVLPIPNVYLQAGRTILHVTAKADPPDYILRQILRMVDIDLCSQPDESGATPLSLICEHGRDLDAVRLLALERPRDFFCLSKEEISESTPCDMLMRRTGIDEAGIAQIIADAAEAWPDGVLHVDEDGGTLLQRAIQFSYSINDFMLIRTILAIHPESIEMTDRIGGTAIHDAAFQLGYAEPDSDDAVVTAVGRLKLLLEFVGSHALFVQDSFGFTPLHVACQPVTPRDAVMMLVASNPGALNVRDRDGMTPLEELRRNSDYLYLDRLPCVCYRGRYYWDENCNKLADTVITMLIGAPVYCSDSPSLHELLHNQECTPDIAKLLIYALRDQANLKDGSGDLPLHIVASRYSNDGIMLMAYNDGIMYEEAIKTLLEVYPAACQISNSEGILPLQLMHRSGKLWRCGMRRVLLQNPAAVLDLELNHVARCALLAKVGSEEQPDALFRLLQDAPVFARRAT